MKWHVNRRKKARKKNIGELSNLPTGPNFLRFRLNFVQEQSFWDKVRLFPRSITAEIK